MRRGAPKIVFGAFCVRQVEPGGGAGGLRYLIIQGQAEGMEGSGEGNCINVTTEHSFLKSPFTHARTHTHTYKTHTLSPCLSFSSWMSLTHFVPALIQVPAGDNLARLLSAATELEMEAGSERSKSPFPSFPSSQTLSPARPGSSRSPTAPHTVTQSPLSPPALLSILLVLICTWPASGRRCW